MYSAVLFVHSWLRWAVLIAGLVACVRAFRARGAGSPWTPADNAAGAAFAGLVDLQFVLGLLLYAVLSPFTTDAFGDMGAAMRNAPLRFFVVEHPFGMIVAAVLVHIGRVRVRKTADPISKHGNAAVFFGLALAIMLLSIPWPGMPGGRPLLRGLFE